MLWLSLAVAFGGIAALISAGYLVWLLQWRRSDASRLPAPSAFRPNVLVVVPTYNERSLIEGKLDNLRALDYAAHRRRIVVADGGSTDGTVEAARLWIEQFGAGADLVETGLRDKTAQIDEALRRHPGAEWILVTDADARFAPETLTTLVEIAADPEVGVVGTRVRPVAAHGLESLHWRFTNWLRQREHRTGCAGIVTGPCYLAHRSILANLPADVVADDVYVACQTMAEGRRVAHAGLMVEELRSPRTLPALLRHKHRKADAYLREILRFLPQIVTMAPGTRAVFLGRAAGLTLVPLLLVLGLASAVLGIVGGEVDLSAARIAVGVLAVGVLGLLPRTRDAVLGIALGIMLVGISALALVTCPFSRQTACFPKIAPRPLEYGLQVNRIDQN